MFTYETKISDVEYGRFFMSLGFTIEEIVIAMQIIESGNSMSEAMKEVLDERNKITPSS